MSEVDFLSAADKILGRQQALQEVNNLFSNGEVRKAKRKSVEFNNKVDSTMKDYYSEHDDVKDLLEESLNPNLYINVEGL